MNKQKKRNKKKFAAQVMAIILTVLMVLSLAFTTVYMIVDNIRNKDEEAEDGHEDHDHAALPAYTFEA